MSFKIGIISDTHLGAFPLDSTLSKDPFETFEEALKILVSSGADIILHAGDFYDRIDPPPWVQDRATAILRSTITGKRPKLKVLKGKVNFEAEDVSIAVPLFLIHGTHDRPIGRPSAAPPFQHLVSAGYANYIDIDPENKFATRQVILEKDNLKISITGVGHRPEGYINTSIAKCGVPHESGALSIASVHNAVKGITITEGEYLDVSAFKSIDYVVVGHAHTAHLYNKNNISTFTRETHGIKLLIPGATTTTRIHPQEEGGKYAHLLEIISSDKPPDFKSFKLTNTRQVFCRKIDATNLTSEDTTREIKKALRTLPLTELTKKPLVRLDVVGKLAKGSSKKDIDLGKISAEYRDAIYNWDEMLVPSELYSEDELRHLEELSAALSYKPLESTALERFSQMLKTLKFSAKYFSPEELYEIFNSSPPTARKRVEEKLNAEVEK